MEKGMKNADVRLGNKRRLIKLLYWNNGISKQDISTVLRRSEERRVGKECRL